MRTITYLKTFKLSDKKISDKNIYPYFEDYAKCCEYELGENENGRKIGKLPENSRYIRKAFASQTYVQNRFAIFAQTKEA